MPKQKEPKEKTISTSFHSPLRQWCISPCFCFPLFPKKFQTPWKIFPILPLPKQFFNFHPPKFLMTFFSWSATKNSEFPFNFRCFSTFPIFRRNYYFPLLLQMSSLICVKIYVFLHTLCVFCFPLLWQWFVSASHNARTGRLCLPLIAWIPCWISVDEISVARNHDMA